MLGPGLGPRHLVVELGLAVLVAAETARWDVGATEKLRCNCDEFVAVVRVVVRNQD